MINPVVLDPGASRSLRFLLLLSCAAALFPGCAPAQETAVVAETAADSRESAAERVLQRELERITARADSVDAIFQPLPLLRPAEEEVFRRYGNQAQLERARALGIEPGPTAEQRESLQREGRLVRLEEATRYWRLRELDYSVPLVVPSVQALLTEIGDRFHARLSEFGLPPYRLEVTSVLRSAENQAALRRVNPNAAIGVSTHEFGTTIDIAYSAFAAPQEPIVALDTGEAPWLEPHLQRFGAAMAETVAARRSRELQAILGRVLIEMQQEGKVMVTLERLQPVYHMTIARRL
ncbi:hypothetical protein BH23GEM3_BH23GEM3_05750 [soil metagenome]|nr:hypothetical protein [Gemmatimonadota bacterium]